MKVGILSESDVDEESIRILSEAVLQRTVEVLQPLRVRTRGWSGVFRDLPRTFKALHWRPDADGMIVVLDSDDTPAHDRAHEEAHFSNTECRACGLYRHINDLRNSLPVRNPPLKLAIGLAVPAIEAWYLCGIDQHSTEGRFTREDSRSLYVLRRELKEKSYGTYPVPQSVAKQKAVEHCNRLVQSLDLLERQFPIGFGTLVRALKSW